MARIYENLEKGGQNFLLYLPIEGCQNFPIFNFRGVKKFLCSSKRGLKIFVMPF